MANLWPMIQQLVGAEPPTTFVSATGPGQCVPVALEREAQSTGLQGTGACHAAAPPGASTSFATQVVFIWSHALLPSGAEVDAEVEVEMVMGVEAVKVANFPAVNGRSLGCLVCSWVLWYQR